MDRVSLRHRQPPRKVCRRVGQVDQVKGWYFCFRSKGIFEVPMMVEGNVMARLFSTNSPLKCCIDALVTVKVIRTPQTDFTSEVHLSEDKEK